MKMDGVNIAYIGGGSRGWAWGLMTDLAMDDGFCGEVRLYDIDRDAAEKNRLIGEKTSAHPKAVSRWRYTVADTLSDALTGADFVVISILPGTFDEMESDVHAPERFGVFQSVGDTTGPGGVLRALRTLPMFEEIGRAIRDYAPKAFVINYTNPMSLCVAALYDAFPEIRAFGCCHEVFGTQKLLCAVLEEMAGIEGAKREEIAVNVQGINHFTWLTSATWRGIDLFPLYRRFCEKYAATGYTKGLDDNWLNRYFDCSHRVKMDLFLRYGKIAAAGDRHLAEFLPPWYLKTPSRAHEWGFSLTPVSWRKKDLADRLARRDRLLSGEEEPSFAATGEEGHLMMKALLGLGDMTTNVNLPNRGQIPNLPLGAVVETNALFRKGAILPVCAGNMDEDILALTARNVANQRTVLKAARDRDLNLAFSAFVNDPLMSDVSLPDARALFDEMVNNTRRFLPAEYFR